MSFAMQFDNGTFACGRWPKDPQQAIGRLVVCPWKTCYEQVTDRIHCGRIVSIVSGGKDPRIKLTLGGGTCSAFVSECFLVPESAEGGA